MTEEELLASLGRGPGDELAPFPDDAPGAPAAPPVAPAPPGVPIVPPPEFGPPNPDATDAIAATMPPVQGGIPTEDPSKQWPPAVPREAPGNAAPGATGPAPQPGDDVQAGMDQVKADRDATNQSLISQHEGERERTHAEAEAATKRREAAEEVAKKEQAAAAQYDAAEKGAAADAQQTKAALANFKFRDLWDSKTTVQKIGSVLSTVLLAIGAGMMKTPKYAIEILDKEKDDDYKRQVDHLNQLKDADVVARTGLGDVRAARARAMADITMGAAHKDRVIAAQVEETSLRAKDQNSAAEGMAYAAKLKQDADEKDLQAHIQLRNFKLQDQAAKAKADEAEALARLHNTQAAAGGYNPNTGRHKGSGSGSGSGGGGGVGRGDAAAQLAQRIESGKDGKPLSETDMIKAANELHIPLEGKAGQVSLKSIRGSVAFNENQANKNAGMGLKEDKQLEAAVRNFASEHQLPKLEAAHRKLEEVRQMLDSGNPTAAMSALMEYDAAAKGSSATESSMHAIQGRLGGTWDRLKGALARQDSGAFGDTERKNLTGAVNVGLKAFKDSVEPIHRAYYERLDGSKPGVKERAAGLFRPFGYDEKGTDGAAQSAKAPEGRHVKNKRTGEMGILTADGVFHPDAGGAP